MDNPQFSPVQEYKEPVNYLAAVFGALMGGAIGVAAWIASVYYTEYIYYQLLAIVGMLVGIGATLAARSYNWKIGLIAVVISLIAFVIGDFLQMQVAMGGNSLSVENYISFSEDLIKEDILPYLTYLFSVGLAFYVGTFGANRSGAQVWAERGNK